MALLEVQNLQVGFDTPGGPVRAVRDLSFSVQAGETLGVVGESGSGKSQTVLAVMGLLANNGLAGGSARFQGDQILNLPAKKLNRIRGAKMSMIFQDPMSSLNPYLSIARQMTEVLTLHRGMSYRDARLRSIEALDAVHIPQAAARIDRYPHEFSGGMRQRVTIAMALLCSPALLIADEPSTALDVTVQAQILDLLRELARDIDMAVLLITHDLGVVAGICDRVLVMYGGRAMEYGTADDIFYRSQHPYTLGLLQSVPRLDGEGRHRLQAIPGNPPDMRALPSGCPFHERCGQRMPRCSDNRPEYAAVAPGHFRACYLEEPA